MTIKRPVLHLIDGSGYIFRAFYAVRPLSTRAGLPTNAVVGFAKMLIKLLREEQPALLGIAFDVRQKTFRHAMYENYKANREVPPEDLAPQFGLIHELVQAMDIPVLMLPGYEADDLLATLTRQALAQDYDVVIVSADKDLMQLVGEHVSMFDPMKDKHFDRAAVIDKFGVPPERVADVLALAGDTSDNIPGVPKVGPKSATKLVADFGDIEQVITALTAQDKRKAYEENVVQHAEQARLSKRLTILAEDAPVTLDTAALRYTRPQVEKLGPFLKRIEAYTMLKEFGLDPDAPMPTLASPPTAPEPPAPPTIAIDRTAYRTLLQEDDLAAMVDLATRVGKLSLDLETTSPDPSRAAIVGIALAVPGAPAVYVPVAHHYLGVPKQLKLEAVLRHLRPVLENPAVEKIGQQLKYAWVVLARAGVTLLGIGQDAMLGAYVLDPARASYSLDALARDFLGHQNIPYAEVIGTGKSRVTFDEVPLETATPYAAENAEVALRVCEQLTPRVQRSGVGSLYREIEIPLAPVLAEMEYHGIMVDLPCLEGLAREFNRRLMDIENEAFALIGSPVNLGSPKQLAYLFFEKLGYPVVKKTKTGYSTDQEVLEVLARTYELPQVILNHRLLSKLKSTYVDALPKMVNPGTRRVHTRFNQTGAATGRLSSSDPNLQNIPIRSGDGRRIRAAFIAPEGWELISADYSQVELRIMAHLSQDEHFVRAFIEGEDIHQRTAREILGGGQEPDAELRRRAKAINFGILYGLSEFGLGKQLNIPRVEAHAYISAYFARYPGIRHFLDQSIEQGRREGYVSTITGRRRYLPDLRSKNGNVRQGAERIAMNTPIQGSAADLIKLAMIRVHRQIKQHRLRARLLLQVHDELVLEAPLEERQQVTELLHKEMTEVMTLRVPLVVDIGHGANWAEAH